MTFRERRKRCPMSVNDNRSTALRIASAWPRVFTAEQTHDSWDFLLGDPTIGERLHIPGRIACQGPIESRLAASVTIVFYCADLESPVLLLRPLAPHVHRQRCRAIETSVGRHHE